MPRIIQSAKGIHPTTSMVSTPKILIFTLIVFGSTANANNANCEQGYTEYDGKCWKIIMNADPRDMKVTCEATNGGALFKVEDTVPAVNDLNNILTVLNLPLTTKVALDARPRCTMTWSYSDGALAPTNINPWRVLGLGRCHTQVFCLYYTPSDQSLNFFECQDPTDIVGLCVYDSPTSVQQPPTVYPVAYYIKSTSEVHVIDLSGNNYECPSFTQTVPSSASIAVVGNKLVMCKNFLPCSAYDPATTSWSPFALMEPYSAPATAHSSVTMAVNDTHFLSAMDNPLDTLFFSDLTGNTVGAKVANGDALDLDPFDDPCLVRVSDYLMAIIGGASPDQDRIVLYNFIDEVIEYQGPIGMVLEEAGCGLINSATYGTEVIVVGGQTESQVSFSALIKTTQIFSVTDKTWRNGKDFPVATDEAAVVELYGGNVAVLGGKLNSDKIYEYDVETDDWLERQETLAAAPRDYCGARYYPAYAAYCTPTTSK